MTEKDISCCFTGYREEKFSFSFELENKGYSEFSERLVAAIFDLYEKGCRNFYNGCAYGFDIASAEILLLLKDKCPDVKLIAVIPFLGQENSWSDSWKMRYKAVINSADSVIVLGDAYSKAIYHIRNRYMVEHCSKVITYFDGESGGTGSTLKYAEKKDLSVINIHITDPNQLEKGYYKPNLRFEITKGDNND